MALNDPRVFEEAADVYASAPKRARYVTSSIKRFGDLFLALLAIIALIPFFAIIGLALALTNKGMILARRTFIGKGGAEKSLLRFAPTHNALGSFLKATKLAELPQLINVARGDLSFVGPKPLQIEDFERSYKYAGMYMKVRPGLTGPSLVATEAPKGSLLGSRLDRNYIMSASFATDLAILLQSVAVLFRAKRSFAWLDQ